MAEIIYAGDGGVFKTCSKCDEALAPSSFAIGRGLLDRYSVCKECRSQVCKKRRLENLDEERAKARAKYALNPEYSRLHSAAWRKKNIDYCLRKEAEYRDRNRDLMREKDRARIARDPERHNHKSREYYASHPDRRIAATRKWQKNNPERVREYIRNLISTPQGKLNNSMRSGVNRGLKVGAKAGRKTYDLLGYTAEELREHLERQFLPGMSWDNYGRGGWSVDHIRPLSSFDYDSPEHPDFKECWSLTNLRPLWEKDNISKGAKILTLV